MSFSAVQKYELSYITCKRDFDGGYIEKLKIVESIFTEQKIKAERTSLFTPLGLEAGSLPKKASITF